jgi:hypothetical protein
MSSVSMSTVIAVWLRVGASVFHDGFVVGCEPEKTKDSGVHVSVCGTQVVDGEERSRDYLDFCEVNEMETWECHGRL